MKTAFAQNCLSGSAEKAGFLYDCSQMEGPEGDNGWAKLGAMIRRKQGSWHDFGLQLLTRPAYWVIVVSNVALFFIPGLNIKSQATTFLYIYMSQSLLIGLVHVIKLNVYRFAPASRPADWKNPHKISIFFILHFGFFHFVYTFFIPPTNVNWQVVWYGLLIHIMVLLLNTIRHYRHESQGQYNANDFMFLPYVRVIPIHIAIILGGFLSAVFGNLAPVLVVLAIIKTAIEIFLEYIQYLGFSFADMKELESDK